MCVCVCVDNVTISFARHAPNMTCVNRHSQILYKRKLIIQRVCGVCVNCSHAVHLPITHTSCVVFIMSAMPQGMRKVICPGFRTRKHVKIFYYFTPVILRPATHNYQVCRKREGGTSCNLCRTYVVSIRGVQPFFQICCHLLTL